MEIDLLPLLEAAARWDAALRGQGGDPETTHAAYDREMSAAVLNGATAPVDHDTLSDGLATVTRALVRVYDELPDCDSRMTAMLNQLHESGKDDDVIDAYDRFRNIVRSSPGSEREDQIRFLLRPGLDYAYEALRLAVRGLAAAWNTDRKARKAISKAAK